MKSNVLTFEHVNVPTLIEANELPKHFGEVKAVAGVDLCIKAGETHGSVVCLTIVLNTKSNLQLDF